MSNMNPTSYLQSLMEKANELRTQQEIRQKELLQNFVKKQREVSINATPQQRKKPLVEPDFSYTKDSVSSLSQLYQESQKYNPFETNKTIEELQKPLTYLDTLYQKVSTSYLEKQNPLIKQRELLLQKRSEELKDIPSSMGGSKKSGSGYSRTSTPNPMWNKIYNEYQKQLEPIEQQISRLGLINKNIFGSQAKTLSELSTELKKYYGQNFENISKEQLAVADLSSFQSLTGDIEKYTSLRDSYIKKYQQTGSQVDLDWVNQYNDLLNSTARSISSELPKIFSNASKTAESIKQTQQSTVASLEALNRAFGKREENTLEDRLAAKKVSDISQESTRQQVVNRTKKVSSFLETTKPAVKFQTRPI